MKTKYLLFIGMIMILGVGCSKTKINGVNMTDQRSVDKAIAYAAENLPDSAYVTKIVIKPSLSSGVTKNAGLMEIVFYTPQDSLKSMLSLPLERFAGRHTIVRYAGADTIPDSRAPGVLLRVANFDDISENINRAGHIVSAGTDKNGRATNFAGVGEYTMVFLDETKPPRHQFSIESRDRYDTESFVETYDVFRFEKENGQLKSLDI